MAVEVFRFAGDFAGDFETAIDFGGGVEGVLSTIVDGEERWVGVAGSGNSRGWWRVETIVAVREKNVGGVLFP